MTNKEIFFSESIFTMSLSEKGKTYIKEMLKNFTNIDPEITNLESWYDINNPDSDGDFMNEISGHYTKDGNPVTFTLDIEEHFDLEVIK